MHDRDQDDVELVVRPANLLAATQPAHTLQPPYGNQSHASTPWGNSMGIPQNPKTPFLS